jgi:hypothetical protein|nr:MAG TPA: hypothetical protein [Caudoviricetes sp.]
MKLNIKPLIASSSGFVKKYSPQILTGLGVGSAVASVYLTYKATIKATSMYIDQHAAGEPTPLALVKEQWKSFLIPLSALAVGATCSILSNSIGTRRVAAMASAYSLLDKSFADYREEAKSLVGKGKEKAIHDKVAEKIVTKNPPAEGNVIVTGNGETMYCDSLSGRYFKSNTDDVKYAINKLNYQLRAEDNVSLNEFYDMLGLEHTKLGEELGWTSDNFVDVEFSAQLYNDKDPVIVLDYSIEPKPDFYRYL